MRWAAERYPHLGHGARQVQLPTVDPPVPARLGPSGLGVYGGMRHHSRLFVLLVPHPTPGPEHRAVQSDRSPGPRPRLEQFHQVASQHPDSLGQGLWQGAKPPLKGAPRREAPVVGEHLAQGAHLCGGLLENGEQFAGPVQAPYDHDHQRLEEEGVGVVARPAPLRTGRPWWGREAVDQA